MKRNIEKEVITEIKNDLLLVIFLKNIFISIFTQNVAISVFALSENITIALVYIVSYLICKIGDK